MFDIVYNIFIYSYILDHYPPYEKGKSNVKRYRRQNFDVRKTCIDRIVRNLYNSLNLMYTRWAWAINRALYTEQKTDDSKRPRKNTTENGALERMIQQTSNSKQDTLTASGKLYPIT